MMPNANSRIPREIPQYFSEGAGSTMAAIPRMHNADEIKTYPHFAILMGATERIFIFDTSFLNWCNYTAAIWQTKWAHPGQCLIFRHIGEPDWFLGKSLWMHKKTPRLFHRGVSIQIVYFPNCSTMSSK